MKGKYLIRLDDACPTMNKPNWATVGEILEKHDIKLLVAVVPDCQDKSLNFGVELKDFWEWVKEWEKKEWTIGMHGYQHVYVELKDTRKSLVPIHNRTEFAGLPYELQSEKIAKAWSLFLQNGIEPRVWVAPSHTFDLNTLRALKELTNIRIVSDCFALDMFKYDEFFFIPQQLWKFVKFPFGLWTICLHPNTMSNEDFYKLDLWLSKHRSYFISFSDVHLKDRKWSFWEKFFNYKLWFDQNKKSFIKTLKKIIK